MSRTRSKSHKRRSRIYYACHSYRGLVTGKSGGGMSGKPAAATTETEVEDDIVTHKVSVTNQGTVTITGVAHDLGTPDVAVVCKDNANPRTIVQAQSITVDDTSFDVVVTFSPNFTGVIYLIATRVAA